MCEVQHHYNFQLTSATPVFIRKGCTDATTIRAQRQAFLNTGIILNSGVSTDIYFFVMSLRQLPFLLVSITTVQVFFQMA